MYCRARLLQCKPGSNPDNLLDNPNDSEAKFADYQEALEDFCRNSVHCPSLVKEQFHEALRKGLTDKPDEDEELGLEEEGEENEEIEFPDLYVPELEGIEIDDEMDQELRDYLQTLMAEKGIQNQLDEEDDVASDYEDDEGIKEDCKTHDWNTTWREQGWTHEKLQVK